MSEQGACWDISDREILLILFESSQAVDVYSFYEKYNLLPTKILTSIRKLQEIGVLVFNPESLLVSLTEEGRIWIVANRREIFLRKIDLSWKAPPSSYLRTKIKEFEPYIPRRRYISKDFFNSLVPKM
ncbi:MAG: hypothetical protein V4495_10990 [Pseudomonadota bacterium]